MLELDALREEVRKLVAKLPPSSATELTKVDCQQSSDNNNNNDDNNNNNNTTTTTTTTTTMSPTTTTTTAKAVKSRA